MLRADIYGNPLEQPVSTEWQEKAFLYIKFSRSCFFFVFFLLFYFTLFFIFISFYLFIYYYFYDRQRRAFLRITLLMSSIFLNAIAQFGFNLTLVLALPLQWQFSRQQINDIFLISFSETGLDISCKLSPFISCKLSLLETICMKCQNLVSEKKE